MSDHRLTRIRIDAALLPERVKWADGLEMSVPSRFACGGLECGGLDDVAAEAFANVKDDLRLRAAFTPVAPALSRLPVSYRAVPSFARHLVAYMIGRIQSQRSARWARYPGWPIDLSADLAADLAGKPGITFARTPVLLTHDIDSAEGLKNLVHHFLPVEEEVGARSASYVVPCAWPLDYSLLAEIAQRGHEIGVHGYDHANRTPFCDPDARKRRLTAGRQFGDRYMAVGYRAPSLLRTPALLADLAAFYRYDSSIPTSGGTFPVPNNGCASARPWRLGGLWEIPVTLPRDGSLRFLGHRPEAIGRIWRETTQIIVRSGGLVSILTHCERSFSGNAGMLAAYRNFLHWTAGEPGFEFVRPADLIARFDLIQAGADACAI